MWNSMASWFQWTAYQEGIQASDWDGMVVYSSNVQNFKDDTES